MTDYTTKKLPNLPLLSTGDTTGDEDILINQGGTDKRIKSSALINGSAQTFDSILFNSGITAITANTLVWNDNEYTINVVTGLGATIQVGQETLVLVYNNTGSQTDNGKIIHPIGAFESGAVGITYELADASDWEKCQGTLLVVTHDIANSSFGLATRFGKVRDLDTSSFTGVQLWLTDDGLGNFTETKPEFPSYGISMGGAIKIDATNGEIFVSILGTENDTFNDAWDGAIRESFNFTTSSNGTTVTGLLENADLTNNLTLLFSDGFYTLDTTTTPLEITLTPGTDGNEATNYVYIPKSTKVLTVNTTGWPTDEHARVAELQIQSASTTQADGGVLGNQNTNDHLKATNDNGHILHLASWIRKQFSTWESGTEGSFDNTGGNGYISITAGVANQLHEQSLASFGMPTDSIRVWNDNGGLRPKITNLTSITAYSDGSSWNNEWGKIVVWRVVNKGGEYAPVMFNLPSGGYNSESNALDDLQKKADYSIPNNLKTKAILIGAFTFRISGGVITYNTGYESLLGQIPVTVAGGGGGAGVTTLLALTDITTTTYIGKAGQVLTVNSGETDAGFAALYKQNSQASASSITPTGDARENEEYVTALAANLTINAPSGTAANGNTLLIRIYGASSYTLTLNAIYNDLTGEVPASTVAGKEMYLACIYNSRNSKFDIVGYKVEA